MARTASTFMRIPHILAETCRSFGLMRDLFVVLPGVSSSPFIVLVDGPSVVIVNIAVAS